MQFFLSASTSVSVLCGDCIDLDLSHYHQNPVRLGTSSTPSPLSFSFRARGLLFAVRESVRIESPPSVVLDPDFPNQETVDACLLGLTHEALESIILVDLETPICCFLDDTRVFNSACMTFLLEQDLEIVVGFVTRETASLLMSAGAKAPALDVIEREYKFGRKLQVETLIVVGVVEANPGNRGNVLGQRSLDVAEVHTLMFSSRLSFCGQSVQTLCGCNSVPLCDQHRWEQLQRACHAHSVTKRHASQQWRHEQQLSGFDLHRQVVAISWDFQVVVPLAVTFRARCENTSR